MTVGRRASASRTAAPWSRARTPTNCSKRSGGGRHRPGGRCLPAMAWDMSIVRAIADGHHARVRATYAASGDEFDATVSFGD